MASKGRIAVTDVAGLVDSIRKHKKFKQLASYSIQCLEKVVAPPRIGWEANARAAFELGAAADIADVCLRFASDPEVFTLSISSLNGIASVPRAAAALCDPATSNMILQAISAYVASLDLDAQGATEALLRVGPAMDLLVLLSRHDAIAFGQAGGINMLLDIASRQPPAAVAASAASGAPSSAGGRTPLKSSSSKMMTGASASLAAAYAALVAACASILERVSRVKGGLDALASMEHASKLLALSTLNLNPPEASKSSGGSKWDTLRGALKRGGASSGGGAAASARRGLASAVLQATRVGGSPGGSGDGSAAPGGPARDLNAHLDPAFRILDRIARSDPGRDLLLALSATQQLSSIMPSVSRDRNLESLAMRVLARLLGSNIAELVDRIAGQPTPGSASPPDLQERILSARLLASMARDEETVRALLGNEALLLGRLVGMLEESGDLGDSEAAAALLQVLRRVAAGDTDNIVPLEAAGAIPTALAILRRRAGDAGIVAEVTGFLAAMVDCSDMVATIEAGTPEGQGGLDLALRSFAQHTGEEGVALAFLELLERVLFFAPAPPTAEGGAGTEEEAAGLLLAGAVAALGQGAVPAILSSMLDLGGAQMTHLQLLATDVLVYLASSSEAVDRMVANGAVAVIIRNLMRGASPSSSSSSGGGGASFKAESDAAALAHEAAALHHGHDHDALAASSHKGEGGGAGGDRAFQALSAELVASTLYLVTSLCAPATHIPLMKEAGIIRAVLAGFSRHPSDPGVYRNFREVVSALDIQEEEVTSAIRAVERYTAKLQAACGEDAAASGAYKYVNEYLHRLEAEGRCATMSALAGDPGLTDEETRDPTALAEKILEGISLLEAVTVSPVFVCVIAADDGVPALLRALGVVSAVRHIASTPFAGGAGAAAKAGSAGVAAAAARGNIAARSFGPSGKGIAASVADEVLSRVCNTVAHLARVAYEIEGGAVDTDPEYEAVDYASFGISDTLYDRDTLEFCARAMSSCARPMLRSFASASITLVSWLASGHTHTAVRDHVEALVNAQAIEACVAMLRAHQGSLEVSAAIAGALTRISVSAKGATAVTARGGSRQIIRMLHATAARRSAPGDELLLGFLRLMDTCAAGGPESAEILRRQGLVEAVVSCMDAGTEHDVMAGGRDAGAEGGLEAGEEDGGEEGPGGSAPVVRAGRAGRSASIGGGTGAGGRAGSAAAGGSGAGARDDDAPSSGSSSSHAYTPDPEVRSDIEATITSILSRLVGPELVRDTVAHLVAAAEALQPQTQPTYDPRRGLHIPPPQGAAAAGGSSNSLTRSIVRLGLLAATEAGGAAGSEVLEAGASACVAIGHAALAVGRATGAGTGAGGASAAAASHAEAELEAGLPASVRTIRQVLSAVAATGGGSGGRRSGAATAGAAAAAEAIPLLFSALDERPRIAGEVVATAAVLVDAHDTASDAVPSQVGGTGLDLLVAVLRDAADHGKEAVARDALLTLAGVGRLGHHTDALVASGAPHAAESFLQDGVTDAGPDTLAAAVLVLAHSARDPSVASALIASSILDYVRGALNLHATDPYAPREPLLHAVGLLLQRLAGAATGPADSPVGEEFRASLRRVIKAGASSTGYIDSPRCACALLDLITVACTPARGVSVPGAEAAKELVKASEGEEFIVQCMSSSAADEPVLASGAAALSAIGSADRSARLIQDIDAYAQRIPEWLEAGYESNAPAVIDLVGGMADLMRSLGSAIVQQQQQAAAAGGLPDLGTPYAEVLGTIWRAVAAICRDDMVSTRSSPSDPQPTGEACGKDLHTCRGDALAVGAQIASRIATASAAAAAVGRTDAGFALSLDDLVSVLYTILAAGHSVLEVRVVESLGRAAETVVELMGDEAVSALCRGKLLAGLISLLQIVQAEAAKARQGKSGGGFDAGGAGAPPTLALGDLARCEASITATLKGIVGRVKASLLTQGPAAPRAAAAGSGSASFQSDVDALADVLTAAAISSAPLVGVGSGSTAELGAEGGEGAASAAAAAAEEPPNSELQQLADALVRGAGASVGTRGTALPLGSASAWTLLSRTAGRISEAVTGPARWASKGLAPLYTVTTLYADVRTQTALIRALTHGLIERPGDLQGCTIPVTEPILVAAVEVLQAGLDVSYDPWRRGRRAVAAGKPAGPALEPKEGAGPSAEGAPDGSAPPSAAPEQQEEPSPPTDFPGTEAENAASAAAYAAAAGAGGASLRAALELFAHIALGSCDPGAAAPGVAPLLTGGPLTHALCTLLTTRAAVEAGASGPALHLVSRLSDLFAPDVARAPAPPGGAPRPPPKALDAVGLAARVNRISGLGLALPMGAGAAPTPTPGLYRLALASTAAPGTAELEAHVTASVAVVSRTLGAPGVDVRALGLDKGSLLALQAAVKRFPDNAPLAKAAAPLIAALEGIYTEQSGAAFENFTRKLLAALAAAEGLTRHMSPDGQMFYSDAKSGTSVWEPPLKINAMMDALAELDVMSRRIEDEAVSAVAPEVVLGIAAALEARVGDPGVVGVLLNALGKLAANADNHAAIEAGGALRFAAEAVLAHPNDARVCEGFASLVLPLSFDPGYVRTILAATDVIPKLVGIIRRFAPLLTTYMGSLMAWPPENRPRHNEDVAALLPDGPDAAERAKPSPRLAQMCVQSLANLACDNEADPATGFSSVARIVQVGGIEALGALMSSHPDSPRLLEDAICALSNMAFVSDTIQLSIGRSCMDTVCAAATNFNADSYLFQMTLRAIGNLTRCDENIMRAVGYGVIRGMVDGMTKHADDPAVLQLCADVIGNMASVDDKKVPRDEGMRILTACSAKRAAVAGGGGASVLIPAPPPVPKGRAPPPKGAPPPRGAVPPPPRAAPPPPSSSGGGGRAMTPEQLVAVLAGAKTLKEAVCTLLYEDGGARALVTAMIRHIRNPDLAGSCLRALHYIGASPELVTRMVGDLRLVDQVVYIMRSIDYRPDVLRRGARVLGLVVGTEARGKGADGKEVVSFPLRDRVLEAGAPNVLLSAIETHKGERELCISCYSVLAMSRSPAVAAAVMEMQAVDTAVGILRANAGDSEYVGVLLELLWGWASEAELASTIATRAGGIIASLLSSFAAAAHASAGAGRHANDDKLQHLNYLLNLVIALVRQRVAPSALLSSGLINGLHDVVEFVVGAGSGAAMIQQRPLVLQVATVLTDTVRPPSGNKEVQAVVSPPAAQAVAAAGGGRVLERILNAYKALPDHKTPGLLLYDQSMCERAFNTLQDLISAGGYTPLGPIQLEPTDGGGVEPQAPGAGAPRKGSTTSRRPAPPAGPSAAASGGAAPHPPTAPQPQPPVLPPSGAGATPAPAGAAAAAAGTLASSAPEYSDAVALLPALRTRGVWYEVWLDGKPRRARLSLTSSHVIILFEEPLGGGAPGAAPEEYSVPLNSIRALVHGLPAGYKKKLIGRNARAGCSLSLEEAADLSRPLLHVEAASEGHRNALSQVFSRLTSAVVK